jgi:hypothetical protein
MFIKIKRMNRYDKSIKKSFVRCDLWIGLYRRRNLLYFHSSYFWLGPGILKALILPHFWLWAKKVLECKQTLQR